MRFYNTRFVRVYLVPGAVFQSVVIGGGYGTGRELVEYFGQYGPMGGLLGMLITVICWALVLGVTYEFARLFKAYDYRTLFKHLLGPGWIAFEILYILMLLLVLAVVASASGEILEERFNLPYGVGLVLILGLVSMLAFWGREVISRVLTAWSFFLYGVFLFYFVWVLLQASGPILTGFAESEVVRGWSLSGFKYAMYNLAVAPALLFSVRDIQTRKEALLSGSISSVICVFPAVLFHITFAAGYPEILSQEVPLYWMMDRFGFQFLLLLYIIMLYGTFIETGIGFVQGVNERIDAYLIEKKGTALGKRTHAVVALAGMLISAGLATVGIIALIAQGYGTISWGFFVVYVIPILTVGVYKIYNHRPITPSAE